MAAAGGLPPPAGPRVGGGAGHPHRQQRRALTEPPQADRAGSHAQVGDSLHHFPTDIGLLTFFHSTHITA